MIPYELAVKYFVNPVKAILIHRLYNEGYAQAKIAKQLGITQPMVYKIVNDPIDKYYKMLIDIGFTKEEIDSYVSILLSPLIKNDTERYMVLFSTIINQILSAQKLCTLHYRVSKDIPYGCNICKHLHPAGVSSPLIIEYERALETLISDPRAYKLVPEVGMNIVYALPGPHSINDIIGLPGRIVKVDSRAEAVGRPCFGCSHHTASILLQVATANPSIRAAAVIRYDPVFIDKLRLMRMRIVETGPHGNTKDFSNSIKRVIRRHRGRIDVIVDHGGYGLEPVIYIFSKDIEDLINILLNLIR